MDFPCEIVATQILPAIKAELARTMKKKNITQRVIAKRLHLTEAAVSQYLSGKRGREYVIPEEILPMFKIVSNAILDKDDPQILLYGVGEICKAIRKRENLKIYC